jgi:hypothetical protein
MRLAVAYLSLCLFALHSWHSQCFPPSDGPWLDPPGEKSVKGFQRPQHEQRFSITPFLSLSLGMKSSPVTNLFRNIRVMAIAAKTQIRIVEKISLSVFCFFGQITNGA